MAAAASDPKTAGGDHSREARRRAALLLLSAEGVGRSTVPSSPDDPAPKPLHYGLMLSVPIPCLDALLGAYTRFSVHSVAGSKGLANGVLAEVEAAGYWTTVTPNVEEYDSAVARAIASGAENVAKEILWCGVMTMDRLRLGNEVPRKRIQTGDTEAKVSPEMLRRIKRFHCA